MVMVVVMTMMVGPDQDSCNTSSNSYERATLSESWHTLEIDGFESVHQGTWTNSRTMRTGERYQ